MPRRTQVARADDERSEARERALTLLYEAESKALPVAEVLDALPIPADPLADLLVRGVGQGRERIDALIGRHAKGWTMNWPRWPRTGPARKACR